MGKTEIPIAHVGPVTIVVCKNIGHKFIIGSDLLQTGNAKIDHKHGKITWYKQKWSTRYNVNSGTTGIDDTVNDTGYDSIDRVIKHYENVFRGKNDVNDKV